MKQIAFIGYGLRSQTMLKAFHGIGAEIEVCAVADPNWKTIAPQLKDDPFFATTRFYDTAEQLLQNHRPDGIFLGTRCNLHTEYANMVFAHKIPLFLEKPVCISQQQYAHLLEGSQGMREKTVVSFPLRFTCVVQEMKRLADSGVLGDIVSVQAINNVPYGSVYYHSWYRDPQLTGGLFLQKATHDLDYIQYILGKRPISVTAKTAKMHFKGDHPAGLRCPDCPEYRTCPESSFVVQHTRKEEPTGDLCCFAKDTGNEDVGAALFSCADGTIISYHQTFLVKGQAGRRGARFIGTKASAEFDFYTAQVRVDYYDTDHTATHQFKYPEGLVHFGGDEMLAREFLSVLDGADSKSDLHQGLVSAAGCLAAKQAAQTGETVQIEYGF